MHFVRSIILIFLVSTFGSGTVLSAEKQALSIEQAKLKLNRFLRTGDTTDLSRTIYFLNTKKAEINQHGDLRQVLEIVLQESYKIDASLSVYLLELVREFYHEDRIKFFEFTLHLHNSSLEAGDYETAMWTAVKIGNIFFSEEGYWQAQKYYKIAEKQAKICNSIYGLSVIYMNYGMVYEKQKKYPQALSMYKISVKYRLLSKKFIANSTSFIKIANIHTLLNKPDSSAFYIQKAEASYLQGETMHLVNDFPFTLPFTKAKLAFLQQQDKLAYGYLNRAKEQAIQLNLMPEYVDASIQEIEFLARQEKHQMVILKSDLLLHFLNENTMKNSISKVYLFLQHAYEKMNDYERAYNAAEKFLQIDDSLKKSAKDSKLAIINSMSLVNESSKMLDKAKRNLKIIAINNENRLKQRNYAVAFSLLSFFLLIILGGLFIYSRKSKKDLDYIHQQLVVQNKNMYQNSQELNQSLMIKDRLLSIIANDLRVPFSELLTLLLRLKKGIDHQTILNPMEKTLTESILLFEDLLSWSQADKNQNLFSPKEVRIDENINKVILFYLPEIQSRGIQFINRSAVVSTFADQNILQTLLRNLLSNAITSLSNSDHTRIIEIKTNLTDTGFIEIIFSDSGAGFPEEVLANFDNENEIVPFHNVRSGMGLVLCNSLAKMSNWTMKIDNESEFGGARIVVTVPYFMDVVSNESPIDINQLRFESNQTLEALKHLKFYQVTEIRKVLKEINHQDDPTILEWIQALEDAIHQGDKLAYEALILKMEKDV